jgi:hypothetical protein
MEADMAGVITRVVVDVRRHKRQVRGKGKNENAIIRVVTSYVARKGMGWWHFQEWGTMGR